MLTYWNGYTLKTEMFDLNTKVPVYIQNRWVKHHGYQLGLNITPLFNFLLEQDKEDFHYYIVKVIKEEP